MKFANFGEQLAKPVKFIKERSAFLPKPIQRIVILLSMFVGLPVFLIGFLVLRIWEYKNVSLYSEYKSLPKTSIVPKSDVDDEEYDHSAINYMGDGNIEIVDESGCISYIEE